MTDTADSILRELVACKDIQDRAEAIEFAGPASTFGENWKAEHDRLRKEYIRRKAGLWDRARAYTATPAGEPLNDGGATEALIAIRRRLQSSIDWMMEGKHTGVLVSVKDYQALIQFIDAAAGVQANREAIVALLQFAHAYRNDLRDSGVSESDMDANSMDLLTMADEAIKLAESAKPRMGSHMTPTQAQALAALDDVIPPHLRGDYMGPRYATLRAFIEAQAVPVHADARDAARYRWLRGNRLWLKANGPYVHVGEFDAAIDAAMTATLEPKP